MKKLFAKMLVLLLLHTPLLAQVSGRVFRDFNGNGQWDTSSTFREPLVTGVLVKALRADGQLFLATTNTLGEYAFEAADLPAGTNVRLHFTGLASGDFPTAAGPSTAGLVRFVHLPAMVDAGINAPDDYWNNMADPDPALLVVQHPRGTYNGYNAGRFSVVQLKNSTRDPQPPPTAWVVQVDTSKRVSRYLQTGTIFGLALHRQQQRVFVTASLKRTFGLGTQGAGGVYIMQLLGGNWTFAGGLSLQGVMPANSSTALDFGSVTRVSTPDTDDNFISGSSATMVKARDNDAFAKVGTMAIGGVDIDPMTDSLYLINLHQRNLVVLDAKASTADLLAANVSVLANYVRVYDLPGLPGWPAAVGAGNTVRPYGIKIYKGRGYIGVVSDAQATQLLADLKGYVLSFDVNNPTAGLTTELVIHFNNYQGPGGGRAFRAWANTWTEAGGTATTTPKFCPQPMISDFEFQEDGSLDIAIRDRWGDQNAMDFNAWPSATHSGATIQQGEVLRACRQGNTWVLEGTSGSCYQPNAGGNPRAAPFNPAGFGNSYGFTSREFYADVSGDGENESAEGAIAKLMGSERAVFTCYDPIEDGTEPTSAYWNTQGLHWNSTITGRKVQAARTAVSATLQVAKANGMGDIEFVTTAQPIQVGNRVWHDVNGDGLQDPDEPGLPGITVILRSPGIDGNYHTADDQTWATTTDSLGHYFFGNSQLTVADTRKPASWVGVAGLLPGLSYRLEIDRQQPNLQGFSSVPANQPADETDEFDSDGLSSGQLQYVELVTRVVNHRFDFGFRNLSLVGDYVWNDLDSDGYQDVGEPGLALVKVRLLNSIGEVIDSTLTNAQGYYRFVSQRGGVPLQIQFVLPEGAEFTMPMAGGNQANNSKADAGGLSPSFNLPLGDSILTLDAGIRTWAQILPVRLIDFQAQRIGATNVVLTWRSDELPGFDHYLVERSGNGVTFEAIGRLKGEYGGATNRYLRWVDPAASANTLYYRLKLVDRDGTFVHSAVRAVNGLPATGFRIGPNPANAACWIRPVDLGRYRVQLTDEAGRLVWTTQQPVTGQTEVPLSGQRSGVYMLQVLPDKGKRTSFRILVQH